MSKLNDLINKYPEVFEETVVFRLKQDEMMYSVCFYGWTPAGFVDSDNCTLHMNESNTYDTLVDIVNYYYMSLAG